MSKTRIAQIQAEHRANLKVVRSAQLFVVEQLPQGHRLKHRPLLARREYPSNTGVLDDLGPFARCPGFRSHAQQPGVETFLGVFSRLVPGAPTAQRGRVDRVAGNLDGGQGAAAPLQLRRRNNIRRAIVGTCTDLVSIEAAMSVPESSVPETEAK